MRTVNQTREERLAQLTTERDRLQTKALAYVELANKIIGTPTSVHAYGKHWRSVASVLRQDAVRLTEEAEDIASRIANLERAKDAAENWTQPPVQPDTAPTALEVLFADDGDSDGEPWGEV